MFGKGMIHLNYLLPKPLIRPFIQVIPNSPLLSFLSVPPSTPLPPTPSLFIHQSHLFIHQSNYLSIYLSIIYPFIYPSKSFTSHFFPLHSFQLSSTSISFLFFLPHSSLYSPVIHSPNSPLHHIPQTSIHLSFTYSLTHIPFIQAFHPRIARSSIYPDNQYTQHSPHHSITYYRHPFICHSPTCPPTAHLMPTSRRQNKGWVGLTETVTE